MNVLLVGEEFAGIQALHSLTRSSHRLVAVMTTAPKQGASHASVWTVAQNEGYETWPAHQVKDPVFGERLRSHAIDLLLNIHSLHRIHRSVLAAPRLGAFNLHPGPLPRYAGLNAVSWAIYWGEKMHGVTVHKMEPGIDTGPIVYQEIFPIEEQDTALSLSFKCVQRGLVLMLRLLEVASNDANVIPLLPQELSRRTYFGREVPDAGGFSWSSSAEKIVNFVRACDYFPFRSPWGCPHARLGHRDVGVLKACRTGTWCNALPGTVGERTGSSILVASRDEWVLVKKLEIGGKYLDAADALRPGDYLGDCSKIDVNARV